LGIAWPNFKAHKILLPNGTMQQSRHVEFDESSPPVCVSRADFTPFYRSLEEPEEVQQAPDVIPVQSPAGTTAQTSPNLELSPVSTVHEAVQDTVPILQENPVYESDPEDDQLFTATPAVDIALPGLRRSERSNRGVPSSHPYDKYLQGFPGKAQKTVSFQC
jgi:hypothetical protein